MKRIFTVFLSVLWMVGVLAPLEGGADTLFRHHFVGGKQLLADTNASAFKKVFSLPEMAGLSKHVTDRLATTPRRALEGHLPQDAKDHAELFGPLISDFFISESWSQVEADGDSVEGVFAIRVGAKRTTAWSRNLKKALTEWKLSEVRDVKVGRYAGWEAKPGKKLVRVFVAGDWIVIGAGTGQLTLTPRALGNIEQKTPPVAGNADALWDVYADVPRLQKTLPFFEWLAVAPVSLTSVGDRGKIKTTGTIELLQPLPKKLSDWRIPTNSLLDNIVSFNVLRGLKSQLATLESWKKLNASEVPDQVITWGPNVVHTGFLYATIPFNNSSNVLKSVVNSLPKLFTEILATGSARFAYASNSSTLSMIGLPYVVPFLSPLKANNHEYLQFGLFPARTATGSPPPGMLEQLEGRDDLVYYGWELTGRRLFHARQAYQLYAMVRARGFPHATEPGEQWVTKVAPLLGNTITELAASSAKELNVIRKSQLGLTGLELYSIVDWVQSPGFPLTWESRPRLAPPREALRQGARGGAGGTLSPIPSVPNGTVSPVPPQPKEDPKPSGGNDPEQN